ncbi:ACP-like domain-containing protein [Advenella mimigardefordensis]|uniref:ACP-like domain-containing protein n=1 Tax=Advenella mimigardefordensis (strain DSM 17166 / LMG 22922 / DPN7) TaxID=1247726 RepID=W0PHQ0_ADVMD|nr:hypothetical protein [Advenella mimigardefordensis]AHG64965.1 hypothetical protein MIM_c29000 [Advenella mimigardefordensis DPN7]
MTQKLTTLAGLVLCAGLAACSTSNENGKDLTQQTVEYTCGQGNTQPVSVQYTFQGEEPLAAKVVYANQAMELTRATTSNSDMVGNTFRGNGYTWTTDKFTREDVSSVNGKMLTQDAQQRAGVPGSTVGNVLVKDCKVGG